MSTPDLTDIHDKQGHYLDSMVSSFETHLEDVIDNAQASLIEKLSRTLAVDASDNTILKTPGNLRILRKLNDLFMTEMDRAGFKRLLSGFTGEFAGQLTFLQEILERLSSGLKTPLPTITWNVNDINAFSGIRASTLDALRESVETAAVMAKNRVMFSIAGMPLKDLIVTISKAFKASIGRATTIAETSMSIFYREASDRAFGIIEDGLKEGTVIKYLYTGPNDVLTRPWCLAHVGNQYTREQIDAMVNGQLPNVWITGGGWNCRHQWVPEIIEATL